MHAIVQHTYGSPDVLKPAELPRPEVGPRQVLVEVHAASVTQGDRRLRSGDFPGITWLPGRLAMGLTGPRTPVPGTGFAGRVVEVGAEVTTFAVGDDVFGGAPHGAYAELLVMEADGPLTRMPDGLTFAEAATLPYGALTALVFLRDLGKLRAGERVCILGASGGVGRMAVQLARHLGADVTAVCSPAHAARVQALGAHVVVDRHADGAWQAAGPYDLILDTVGAVSFLTARRALAPGGRHASLHVTTGQLLAAAWTAMTGGRRALLGVALPSAEAFDEVRGLVETGALRPVLAGSWPLADAALAHARLEAGNPGGDLVVSPTMAQAA
ncbi:MAG: NAD(P)-dependent alcohol dehydrogenase [Alphaproteobacteria bacterium]|nr:NAD(P)-dependent alcohol dehydrogenase [Alphaproteobacteria bacterium]